MLTDAASKYFKSLADKGTFLQKLGRTLKIPFSKMFPVPPAAREYSTGLTMGEHCELMIREFKIPRESQDVFALASHQNASKARSLVHDQIISVKGVDKDNLIRDNASLEAMAKLAVAFDKKEGTITAGNASPYTDGAAGLYVISPAIEGAIKPDAHLIDFEYVGVDPDSGLLMGPGKAVLRVLERHQMKWSDLDYIDIHEAFAGQVLCVVAGLNDSGYRAKNYGINYDPGFLDEKRLNRFGNFKLD
ncbi:MAG: hypothetical protein HZC17_07055 [Candidatus Omnitrophica bacterium]|nr:hypothetical protein [Candidatus Omnitrophota bacterium]